MVPVGLPSHDTRTLAGLAVGLSGLEALRCLQESPNIGFGKAQVFANLDVWNGSLRAPPGVEIDPTSRTFQNRGQLVNGEQFI